MLPFFWSQNPTFCSKPLLTPSASLTLCISGLLRVLHSLCLLPAGPCAQCFCLGRTPPPSPQMPPFASPAPYSAVAAAPKQPVRTHEQIWAGCQPPTLEQGLANNKPSGNLWGLTK